MAVRKIESTQTLEEFRLEFNAMTEYDFGDIATLDPALTATTVIGAVNELSAVVSAAEGFLLEDASSTVQSIGAGQTMRVFGVANQTTAVVSVPDTVTIGLTNDVTISNDLTVNGISNLGTIKIEGNEISSTDSTRLEIADALKVQGELVAGVTTLNPPGSYNIISDTGYTIFGSIPYLKGREMLFEGLVDDPNKTTLRVIEPTGNRVVSLPDATGTVALVSDITSTTGYATSSIFSTAVSLTIYDSTGTAVKTIFGSTT